MARGGWWSRAGPARRHRSAPPAILARVPRPTVAAALLAPLLAAQQGAWSVVPGDPAPPRWTSGLMAFDRARGCTVLVNGSDVWEAHGTAWRLAASPPNTGGIGGGFTFDGNRQRCLWFGGLLFFSNQLSEWDGASWHVIPTAHAPSPRGNTAMAFDELRARTVLFGGWTGSAFPNDTWEFDGLDWQQVFPATSPPGASRHRMTYDRARGEVVLCGDAYQPIGCWRYDGLTWKQAPPGPPAFSYPALVYDEGRARTVLAGFASSTSTTLTTWEWDGAAWSQPQPNGPRLGFLCNGAYDPVRGLVHLVGSDGDGAASWGWTGASWVRGTPFGCLPTLAGIAAAYHAPSRTAIAFGGAQTYGTGTDDTYAYQQGGWRVLAPPNRPPARGRAALAAEPTGDLLLTGGLTPVALADTWRWNGATWTQLFPAASPPARGQHGMVADPARGRIVLFGGADTNGAPFGDTWEWDGTNWSQRSPTNAPSPRPNPAMTYDALRARTLLFGGGSSTIAFTDDLWEWDGTHWLPRPLAVRPAARGGACFTFDPSVGKAVLAGGFVWQPLGFYAAVADTWLWDGVSWTQAIGSAPAYDANAVVLFHGELGGTLYSSPVSQVSTRAASDHLFTFGSTGGVTSFGAGCPGATGAPLLSALGAPRPGNHQFGIWLCNARAGALAFVGFDWQTAVVPLGNGCQALLPSAVLATRVTDMFGNALVAFPLPASPALQGLVLHGQGVALDPAGALFGAAALTDGLRIVFG